MTDSIGLARMVRRISRSSISRRCGPFRTSWSAPGRAIETAECWQIAIETRPAQHPALTRQNLRTLRGASDGTLPRGAYILAGEPGPIASRPGSK